MDPAIDDKPHLHDLAQQIKQWARELGFDEAGITDTSLHEQESHFLHWLEKGFHGEMDYMKSHGTKRSRPTDLIPGTLRVISARMDYMPHDMLHAEATLQNSDIAYISRYALGKDYHKLIRKRLAQLSERINNELDGYEYRAFTDSAPVLEKALAEKAGLGWIGKHSNLLNKQRGSYFFLGEIYTNLPLPVDKPAINHCGSCSACIDVCPTQAIIGPYQIDARRCISYLTIELKTSIPKEFRSAMGNRVYGCDDCQLVCPWNKFAQLTTEAGFLAREDLSDPDLLKLFEWTEDEFLKHTEGNAIRRIGYERWQRNIAVALGNCVPCDNIITALQTRREESTVMVQEHIDWALEKLKSAP
ncbi:MAG: tRNA epoxyqueuosine(34) reductase QueG [Proteobacteria bacterium]|jgi:epoxyqueuosine reductase|nr:tRNA epoxyqueuosine(34) reductase QueG [Pseudomonadota bacterium]